MEIQKIEKLSCEWHELTDKVIEFQEIDLLRLQELFRNSYDVIEAFRKDQLIPKAISKLFLEMNDFAWWVYDLDKTPLHEFYQGILTLISALNEHFFVCDYDVKAITEAIAKISDGEFQVLDLK